MPGTTQSTTPSVLLPVSIEMAHSIGCDCAQEWLAGETNLAIPASPFIWRSRRLSRFDQDNQAQADLPQLCAAWEEGFDSTMSNARVVKGASTQALSDMREAAIDSTEDAVNLVCVGRSSIAELRAILRAIVSLSGSNDVIHDLAQVGADLADSQDNFLDCERSDMQEKLTALRAGGAA